MRLTNARRRRPVFADDIRSLGGAVNVIADRDRIDGSRFWRLNYLSGGGDLGWTSPPIADESIARASADTLAAFVNALVCK
jgi:hypothetical protein